MPIAAILPIIMPFGIKMLPNAHGKIILPLLILGAVVCVCVRLEKNRYLCPIGQGQFFRRYFTLMNVPSPRLNAQVIQEWRFFSSLPFWHAEFVAHIEESDKPVLGTIDRLIVVISQPYKGYGSGEGGVELYGAGDEIEVVDCDIRDFLPSHPYVIGFDVLKYLVEALREEMERAVHY